MFGSFQACQIWIRGRSSNEPLYRAAAAAANRPYSFGFTPVGEDGSVPV